MPENSENFGEQKIYMQDQTTGGETEDEKSAFVGLDCSEIAPPHLRKNALGTTEEPVFETPPDSLESCHEETRIIEEEHSEEGNTEREQVHSAAVYPDPTQSPYIGSPSADGVGYPEPLRAASPYIREKNAEPQEPKGPKQLVLALVEFLEESYRKEREAADARFDSFLRHYDHKLEELERRSQANHNRHEESASYIYQQLDAIQKHQEQKVRGEVEAIRIELEAKKGECAQLSRMLREANEMVGLAIPNHLETIIQHLPNGLNSAVFASLLLLDKIALLENIPASSLLEVTQILGISAHKEPDIHEDTLMLIAEKSNEIFRRINSRIKVRLVRKDEPIDPTYMDGSELQGKRFVGEVKTWALLDNDRVVRKAQVTGK